MEGPSLGDEGSIGRAGTREEVEDRRENGSSSSKKG